MNTLHESEPSKNNDGLPPFSPDLIEQDWPDVPEPLPRPEPATKDDGESALRDVLVLLRTRTGRDFSYYKRATILRRIGRRMQVNSVLDLPAYLKILRIQPGEAGALLQDLLISVTNFFRDRKVFVALEKRIPDLFKNKSQNDTVRVWCPACATGEEAYSLAILLLEFARSLESPKSIQVFACDIDDEAVQIARSGQYPETITADVNEDRLRRFFVKDAKGYRVRRELREMILFASHDLLKDAPFSRMDLISCRNLMIYLSRDAQQRVLATFHFSLKPGGLLLLGSSEAVEDGSPLFNVVDKKNRIYAQQPSGRIGVPIPTGPTSLLRVIESQKLSVPVVHGKNFIPASVVPFHNKLEPLADRGSLAELHFQLIERYGPPSVIVNSEYEIMHLSEHAGEFLQFTGGEPSRNLLRVVNPSLRIDLRTALFRAAETNSQVETLSVPAEIRGERCSVQITVAAAAEFAPGVFVITFEKHPLGDAREPVAPPLESPSPEPVVPHLEWELEQAKSHLRDTVEQYEASTEELKASNEERQAMNEELRSATEELETSREEPQSINEELMTVNQEMKGKMDEVARANSDLQNLMASTSIATVFLDRELAITRFTPAAAAIFNMIPGDVGRPLAHLKHELNYPDLISDAAQVLKTLLPVDREVTDGSGWYLARFQPYRTIEDHIAGVVLTLADVTERNRAIEALRLSEERMRILIESAKDYAIFTMDLNNQIDSWNKGAESLFGYSESEVLGRSADVLFTPKDRANGDLKSELETARTKGHAESERWYARKDESLFYGSGSVMPLRDKSGELRGHVKIMRDLTVNKQAEEEIEQHVQELMRFNAAAVGRESRMIELKREVNELCERLKLPKRYSMEWDDRDQGAGER